MIEGYIPKDQRKKILLLSDDLRMSSGVGTVSKDIVLGTAHKYRWVQVGAAINHPEHGKIVDVSKSVGDEIGIDDAEVRIYPWNGYGDPNFIRHLMMTEQPNAIMHFTDPRFWIWLYQMESEIREYIPLMFYHVWDDTPYPQYNQSYYRSCDWIGCISKQTYNVVKNVWKKDTPADWQVKYIAHGGNEKFFKKLSSPEDNAEMSVLREKIFNGEEVDFVVLYNNRNIRRKMTGDVILAYQHFVNKLPKEKADRCRLLMHTQPVDENGTDLPVLIRDVAPECRVTFSADKTDPKTLNMIYNISDVTINLASNEGFGLATMESLLAGTPIIVNVTGGLQDQCGFQDDKGNYLTHDKHFSKEWGTNADGKYKTHGKWVLPIFPSQRALIGSPATPYIFDDRCKWEDAGDALLEVYNMSKVERTERGMAGREFALGAGEFTAKKMSERFIEGIEDTFRNWRPRPRFVMEKI